MSAFTAKYRPGRYAIWTGVCCVIWVTILGLVDALTRPPLWLLLVIGAALGLITPSPKWIRR